MIQTKFFDSDKLSKLEDSLNSYLKKENLDRNNIVKIRYYKNLVEKTWINEDHDVKSWFSYSVMVVIDI